MLVVRHNLYNKWIYPGGHADGEEDLLSVALREVEEESGIKAPILDKNIFGINANASNTHIKGGKIVPSHIYILMLFTYLKQMRIFC